jgi:hypothetical protein
LWKDTNKEMPKHSKKNLFLFYFVYPNIPYWLPWDDTYSRKRQPLELRHGPYTTTTTSFFSTTNVLVVLVLVVVVVVVVVVVIVVVVY